MSADPANSATQQVHILRIAVPTPLRRYFDYLPPAGCDPATLLPGIRLRVPFGPRRQVGVLLEIRHDSPIAMADLRHALEILDREPLLPPDILELIRWAQSYYHHPPGEVYATALPILLRRGQLAQLQFDPLWRITEAGRKALRENSAQRAPRQRVLLERLAETDTGLTTERLRQILPSGSTVARTLLAKGWLQRLDGDSVAADATTARTPQLMPDQAKAISTISNALDRFNVFLLDGVTGSGKTEVYLRLIDTVLTQGKQALVLVPEISLTPQMTERFRKRLSQPLAVLHSGLGDRERLNAWLLARNGKAGVVLGTRSAIFTPLSRPGLIIIDEEHDSSFKQQDGFRYNARDLAVVRAQRLGLCIVLGSATPSLESLYNVSRQRYRHVRLPERVGQAVTPTIQLLDVRRLPLQAGISAPLLELVGKHLQNNAQVLLFLNRRGYAPTLMCHECGWLGSCHQCDAYLTLHLRRGRLLCHHCGTEQSLPHACPACGSVDMRALGQGTERIEKNLEERFPNIGIARIDRDSTRRRGSLQNLLTDIHSGQRRILIGTQMLAKGHHFPDVTLVGIVDTDQGLFSADYRAGERMAQLLVQVAGRAGRAERPGTVVIQTHCPDHPLLQLLIREGYAAFAQAILEERRQALLPPYSNQALLRADATVPQAPLQFLSEAAQLGSTLTAPVDLLGPIPAPMERRAGRYRAQLLVQCQQRPPLHRFLSQWLEHLETLTSARRVRWSLDIDPIDLF